MIRQDRSSILHTSLSLWETLFFNLIIMSTDNNWLPLNADVGGQPNRIKKILSEEEIIEFNMYQDK